MPRICDATCSASAGVLASLMPPALPRLPVGPWALPPQGPISPAAVAAPAAPVTRMPRGTGMPAGESTSDFAACSSKFMNLLAVFFPMRAVQSLFARLFLGNGGDEVGDVEEVLVVQVLRD